jgi:hypothetical protein
MVMVRVPCAACDGNGRLPPLGNEGDPRDIKRFFPRPCDACNCSRFVYVNKVIEEKHEKKNDEYVAGQGDC